MKILILEDPKIIVNPPFMPIFSFLWGGYCGGGGKKFYNHKIYTNMSSHKKNLLSTPKNGFTDHKGRITA